MLKGRPSFVNGDWIFVVSDDGTGLMDEGTFNRVKARRAGIEIDPMGRRRTIYWNEIV